MKDYEVTLEVKKAVCDVLRRIDDMKSGVQEQVDYYKKRWEESGEDEESRDSYYKDEAERFMIQCQAYDTVFKAVYKLL